MDEPIKKPETSDIPDIYADIEAEKSGIERLLDKIPGLAGYREKNRRREADAILRRTIAERLDAERLRLGSVYQTLSSDIVLAIDHAESLGRVDGRLAGLIGKIKDAPTGYSGAFAANKIKENDLMDLYGFDASMLAFTDAIGSEITELGEAVDARTGIATAIRALDVTLQEAVTAFNARSELLSGVS